MTLQIDSAESQIPPTDVTAQRLSSRYSRLIRLVLTATIVGFAVWRNLDALVTVGVVFVLVAPFEKLFPRHRQPVLRRALGTDVAFALSTPVIATAGIIVGTVISAVSLVWLPALLLRPAVTAMPDGWRTVLGVVAFDFVSYWAHRFAHEIPAGWRFHKVHHSTQQLDWVSGFRNHPFDGLLLAPPFVFLLVAGFPAELGGVLVVIQGILGLFLHANVRWRWRPLHRVVITPEFHHWHHSNEREAHGTNYSVGLPLWDIVFGTYRVPRDRRPQIYGIDEPMPDGMLPQLWEPLRDLPRPWRELRHPVVALRRAARWVRRTGRQMLAILAHPRRARWVTPAA